MRQTTVKDDGPNAFGKTKPVAMFTVAGDTLKGEVGGC